VDASALRAVEGEFTLRGVTRPRLDVGLRCAPARERCHAEVAGRIRAAFGMGTATLIGDGVDSIRGHCGSRLTKADQTP
jgi:polyisoprenoid-binding protein YceI